jgi:hypothetical protein
MARRTHGLDHLEDALAYPRLAALGLEVRSSAPDEGFGVAIRAVLPPDSPIRWLAEARCRRLTTVKAAAARSTCPSA